jgi:hypothetical protein
LFTSKNMAGSFPCRSSIVFPEIPRRDTGHTGVAGLPPQFGKVRTGLLIEDDGFAVDEALPGADAHAASNELCVAARK